MTIANSNFRDDYIGNGATAVYDYNFKIFNKSHLLVVVRKISDDVETFLVLDTDYSVQDVGEQNGGTITLLDLNQAWLDASGNLSADYALAILLSPVFEQQTDLRNQGAYSPANVEDQLDKLYQLDLKQEREIDLSLKLPVSLSGVDTTLPAPVADAAIGWNTAKTALVNLLQQGSIVVSAVGQLIVNIATTAALRSLMRSDVWCGTAGGTANALTLTPADAIAGYSAGDSFTFKSGAAANTGATTINISGVSASAAQSNGVAMVGGEIEANKWYRATYDGAAFQIERIGPAFPGVLSPAQITINQNNYAPINIAAATVLRISADARRNVTGLTSGTESRLLTVHNVGTFPIVFTYEDELSIAANRFAFGCTLGGGQSMEIQYDSVSSRWRVKSMPEPIGTIKDFGTSVMPAGFLAIDQDVSRTTYAALFNEIGTTWGAGDGATTFGLFIGAGAGLIAAGTGTQTASGEDADVDTTNDTLTVASNTDKWITGMAVVFNLTSGTITGLADDTTYYVIRNSATTIKLASTLANAQNGTAINFTAKSSPVWDITHTYTARTHGQRIGAETHAISSTEVGPHNHTQNAHSHTQRGDTDGGTGTGSIVITDCDGVVQQNNSAVSTAGATATNQASAGGVAANIMNPSTVVTRGIRYV